MSNKFSLLGQINVLTKLQRFAMMKKAKSLIENRKQIGLQIIMDTLIKKTKHKNRRKTQNNDSSEEYGYLKSEINDNIINNTSGYNYSNLAGQF